MEAIKNLIWPTKEIFVGTYPIGLQRGGGPDIFHLLCRVALRYMRTGKIEANTDCLSKFLVELLKTDAHAKWSWFMRRAKTRDYLAPGACAVTPLLPLVSYCVLKTLGLKRSLVKAVAVGVMAAPVCYMAAYSLLPRESISCFRLRTEAQAYMEDEDEATDCLTVKPAREIKGKDGEDLVTGSRLTKVVASTGRPKRRPYAAKIAQVARAKVGYLKNTPENRLIYQRVLIEIMDKDCVRYVDRDVVLPLAIGCCFVYPEGVEETAALWGSQESLGVK